MCCRALNIIREFPSCTAWETVLLKAIFSPEGDLSLQLIPCRRESEVLTQIEDPSSLFQHLSDISFGAEVSEDGIITEGGTD